MQADNGKFFLLHNQMRQPLDIIDFLDFNLAKNLLKTEQCDNKVYIPSAKNINLL